MIKHLVNKIDESLVLHARYLNKEKSANFLNSSLILASKLR